MNGTIARSARRDGLRLRIHELTPIKETREDYEAIRLQILELFRKEIYLPLVEEFALPKTTLIKNSLSDLVDAIRSGRIQFYRGRFTGKFNSTLSRELRRIGAEWDRKQGSFAVPQSKLPADIRIAIAASEDRFRRMAAAINKRLAEMSPAEIAGKINFEKHFDSTLFKTDKKFQKSIEGITVAPQLTKEGRARIAAEYSNNMQLYIQDFAEKEITELRNRIQERSFAGFRFEGIKKEIQDSYGVSVNKAKFLAKQETSLLMTKFKQVRYQAAGVNDYKWGCVAGSAGHEVRPMHKALEGKTFQWNNPPVVNKKGERKNPGQDYGCRCFAIPLVKF